LNGYLEDYKSSFKKIIMNNIGYRQPNLINDEYQRHLENLDCQLFVFPTFLTSGKHYYIVDA